MARKTAIFYLIIASLWILLSDAALEGLAPSLNDVFYVSKLKGIFFVCVTGVLLYFFVAREQEKKRKLEQSFTELFQNNPNPMWLSRYADNQIIAVNESACQLYGYAADAFIRLRADDLKSSTPAIHHAMADYECHRTASGADVWVKYFNSQTQIAGEALMVHMVISADEDVEAEAKRLEVQQRYSDLLNNMEDYVFGISRTGFFTICNQAFEAYIGQGPLVGKAALAVLDGGTGGAWTEMMANYNQGNQYYAEWYDPGRERWLRITQYQGSDGIGFFASDIGEQKALKHTISQHENTLKAIVNASEDLIWAFDRTYKLLIANKAFKYSTAAMYGMPLSKGASILPETEEGKSTIKHWIAAYERALLGEAVYEILTDKAEDGREIVMDVRLYPIMDDSGMVICVGCFAHDITKRRQHEKHIERQNKQLMEIAWIQSHELRAPLANILGLVQLLRIDGENKSYYEMYLQKLQEASNELDRIIHEVVARSVIPFEQSDSHAPSA